MTGFGGGNLIEGNLLFNTGRVSAILHPSPVFTAVKTAPLCSYTLPRPVTVKMTYTQAANKDEGSINSWDRVPYITTFRNGTASTVPAWNNVTNNFFLANYNPSLAIDNDDGSSFWQHRENFVVYGQAGFKADFGAHNLRSVGNYYAYIDSAWTGWPSSDGWFVNNSAILGGHSVSYFGQGYRSDCGLIGRPELGRISGNTLYSRDTTLMVPCLNTTTGACTSSCTLQQWVKGGHDRGTTLRPVPRDEKVIDAARVLLKDADGR